MSKEYWGPILVFTAGVIFAWWIIDTPTLHVASDAYFDCSDVEPGDSIVFDQAEILAQVIIEGCEGDEDNPIKVYGTTVHPDRSGEPHLSINADPAGFQLIGWNFVASAPETYIATNKDYVAGVTSVASMADPGLISLELSGIDPENPIDTDGIYIQDNTIYFPTRPSPTRRDGEGYDCLFGPEYDGTKPETWWCVPR